MSVDANVEAICLAPGCRRFGNTAVITERFVHGSVIPDPFAYEDTELNFFDRIEEDYADVSWLEELYIGPGTEVISNMAFVQCGKLKRVVIAEGVTSIGEGAFKNCFSLTSILLPKSLTSIGCNAFSGCSSLASIAIPKSVTSIGDNAFEGCNAAGFAISAPGGSYAEKYARKNGISGIKVAPIKMPVPPVEKTTSAVDFGKGFWKRLFGKDK